VADLKTVVAERFQIRVERASLAIVTHSCRVTPPGKWTFTTNDPDLEVTPDTIIQIPTPGFNVTLKVK
jgi:hypothetical protein